MEMVKTHVLVLFAGLLVFLPKMEAQSNPPPLCASQYALVNYACAFAPSRPSFDDHVYLLGQGNGHEEGNRQGQNFTLVRSQAQKSGDEHGHGHNLSRRNEHEGGHNHRHEHGGGRNHRHEHEGGRNHRHEHEGGRNHRHENEGGHNHRLQHGSRHEHGRGHHHRNEDEDEHEHGSRHRHRHRRSRHHRTHSQEECCKWLNELDDECVCYLLVRLPPFLSRQEHKYSIRVGDSCKVSYSCPGRIRV